MIVVDEQIHGRRIRDAIASWYPGQVVSIKHLRPNTLVKDDAIPALLQQARQPTFITINADDFGDECQPIACIALLHFLYPRNADMKSPIYSAIYFDTLS
ncbi:MAG: hypothetical protein KDE19_16505 [Caldilineaceae bacterium]|nr:hypothetical protein [Caldilineaceae bacterium]